MVNLEAQPLVQRISLQRAAAAGEGETQSSEGVSCSLAVDLVRGGTFIETMTLSPFRDAEEIEELLNMAIPETSGHVIVRRRGSESESDRDWFLSSDMSVEFDVVYLTPLSVATSNVVTLATCLTGDCDAYCMTTGDANATRHDLTVSIETVQEFSSPDSFQVAFNTNSQQPRRTGPLPLNATNDALCGELTELLSWECNEEEGIAEKTIFYEEYETLTRDTSNSTSFCGAYSRINPYIFWSGGQYRVDNVPYVSASVISHMHSGADTCRKGAFTSITC